MASGVCNVRIVPSSSSFRLVTGKGFRSKREAVCKGGHIVMTEHTNRLFDRTPCVQPCLVRLDASRTDHDNSNDGKYHDDEGERENAADREFLSHADLDIPEHVGRNGDYYKPWSDRWNIVHKHPCENSEYELKASVTTSMIMLYRRVFLANLTELGKVQVASKKSASC